MPTYDAADFRPPAPVAPVTVRSPQSGTSVPHVSMLIDTGADISLLPRDPIAGLIAENPSGQQYELAAFDGTTSFAPVVRLELTLLGKTFRGQFLLIEGRHGILGRNILNSLAIELDGPSLRWDERR